MILVTNDDGISAKGIHALVEVAREFGEILVVAPDSPRSAQGHAITLEQPLRLHQSKFFSNDENITAYECTGTPVDCVKLAKHVLLKGKQVDLCVSGINHGSNASVNILYSGTMSAAMEASVEGIPSVGFSLLDFHHDADFEAAKKIVRRVLTVFFKNQNSFGKAKLLNVNIPKLPFDEIKGLRVCRQAEGLWEEEFKEGIDGMGRTYYWLTGKFHCNETDPQADVVALSEGFVSVVPSMHDLTDYVGLEGIQGVFE